MRQSFLCPQDPTRPLFVYGSMLDAEVLQLVLGGTLAPTRRRSATLADHRRVCVPDETYPVLVPSPGEVVSGAVVFGLDEREWARVAFFESVEYGFGECAIALDDAATVAAYLCAASAPAEGPGEPWDPRVWRARHRTWFVARTRAFMALFGRVDTDAAEAFWQSQETA